MAPARTISSKRLWAVTCYYNPVPYRRRLDNYRIFRERFAAPLLTVELAYGATPDLGEGDADILVQLRGRDVMWQKERLLNLAVSRLPAECDRVAWLDCDIILAEPNWAAQIDRKLDDFALVQGFGRGFNLGREWQPGMPFEQASELARPAVCKAIADGLPPRSAFHQPMLDLLMPHLTGYAWAAHRELLERVGLYDAGIVGGGDRLLAAATYGCIREAAERQRMTDKRFRHFSDWAVRWQEAVGGSVGALDGDAFSMWHGELPNRRYGPRQVDLNEFDYDPDRDIALDAQGAWRWNSDKPAMHAFLRDYFVSRREDG